MKQKCKAMLAAVLMGAVVAAAVLTFLTQGPADLAPWLLVAVAVGIPFLLREQSCEDFVAWKDDYAVGIEAIDQDHKKLLTLINAVLAASRCRTGVDFERQALDELVDYTMFHFKREEDLMQAHGYRDFEGHKAQHDQMVTQVRLFRTRYEEKGREALPEVARHLKLWLLQHIAATDKKYAPFLLERLSRPESAE